MAASQLLGAALRYASLGLRVIPLHHFTAAGRCSCKDLLCPRKRWGKHPQPRRNWPLLATCDQEVIRSWWSRWPDANVGIATGQGKVALDADGEEGHRSLIELQQQYGSLPPTALARTGSGGLHYLFDTPVPIQNSSRRCRPGLDTRGERGLIVAAPSLHYSGNRYRWVRHPAEGIAPIPDWLLDVLRQAGLVKGAAPDGPPLPRRRVPRPVDGPRASWRPAASPDARETPPDGQLVAVLVQEVIRRFPVTGYGERNDRMCVAVSSLLGRGFSPEVTAAVMTAWLGHYRGMMRTEQAEAEALLAACIESTLNSPDFRAATALIDHDHLCQEITLTPLQKAFLHSIILPEQFPSAGHQFQLPPDNQHQSLLLPCHLLLDEEGDGGAWMRARAWWSDRLCKGVQERAFVEGWLVHCLHRVLHLREEVIRATHDQVRAIIRSRYGLELDNQQFARLKARYVTRPDRPATRFELLRELRKGRKTPHGSVPSEYELTGLRCLFDREGIVGPGAEHHEQVGGAGGEDTSQDG